MPKNRMNTIKLLMTLVLFVIVRLGVSQNYAGRNIILYLNEHQGKAYCVGNLPKTSEGVFQKFKVTVFGGNWHNYNTAENSYYISTRDGLVINQEVHGGSYSKYEFRVYDNGSSYDFVIVPIDHFTSFNIQSWLLEGSSLSGLPITDYVVDGKNDVTHGVIINQLFITSHQGSIGIGKSPESNIKLDVAGTIRATEVKVEAATTAQLNVDGTLHANTIKVATKGQTADHVFADDYPLRPLGEVEQFIIQNKHLLDIPCAKQMEAEGMNLAEMNKMLLQKIEELTLYTIYLEKRDTEREVMLKVHLDKLRDLDNLKVEMEQLKSILLKE